MTPCVIITKDRVSYTRLCVASLERYDVDIHLVDHGSTWPPMLHYLANSPHPVHYRGPNPPRSLWQWDHLGEVVGGGRYLVTDPDIVLDPACPDDWLHQLHRVLDKHELAKVGLGLRLDDLPDTPLSAKVRAWERPFWVTPLDEGLWTAPVDTTLALHPPLHVRSGFALHPAARLGAPYLIRHLPWYGETDLAEGAHYRTHMIEGSSHWANGGW